ncbi:hypothetical protein K5D33_03825 [Pseudomonas cichorii]|nr:hypothetical protein [Pseudomonas cichorii]MBX8491450.1 hypothetical protein [Pseudomonas cichorii]MBX8533841.1 hypothetical protein [Pseudomonas cichorii]MBX8540675.1 hypothetical protein [Pseudomonas cichorii]MBX8543777.1 hypothetical protein [Pseudomonas cichorii]MBX8580398.1 hypothetical protein [Pseudomonas cichorii]
MSWPGKGVDYYAYVETNEFTTLFQQPTDWGDKKASYQLDTPNTMQHGNLQISENDIGYLSHTGRYSWQLSKNQQPIADRYADIAPFTGNLGDTTLGNMLQTPSLFGQGWAVSYGFYDSGSGSGGLTNQDQSYVYATGDMSGWMGDLANSMGAALTEKPFSTFALPGAHDAGMFDPTLLTNLLNKAEFLAALTGVFGSAIALLAKPIALRAIINLAFTQKDNITAQLNLGTRYFDFRPGYCYQNITDGIYHQHNLIPGYSYQSFLEDILSWLDHHPTEIVIISPNFQGFAQDAMKPAPDVLDGMLNTALANTQTQGKIVPGYKGDLASSYTKLLSQSKRLILLPQTDSTEDASKYDSYNGSYTTTDVSNILAALNGMNASTQAQNDYTVLQLQGTASGVDGAAGPAIVTLSDASSPLMSTKPGFDFHTYPWLVENVASNLSASGLVVFLNDFCDNALASIVKQITQARAGKL